jgi:hypothetical protein
MVCSFSVPSGAEIGASAGRTRYGGTRFLIIKTAEQALLYLDPEDSLEGANHIRIISGNKPEGIAGFSVAASTSDLVGIGVDGVRHVIIDNMGNLGHVDPPAALSSWAP